MKIFSSKMSQLRFRHNSHIKCHGHGKGMTQNGYTSFFARLCPKHILKTSLFPLFLLFRYTTFIMVLCYVIGTKIESSFVIKVRKDKDITVSEFKTLIFKQKKYSFKNKGFDVSDLRLWEVDIPTEENKLNKLKELE